MKRLEIMCLVTGAVFAIVASVASSASAIALPNNLPESSAARPWTGETDEANPKIVATEAGAPELICTKATLEGEEEAKKPLGPFHIHFTGCESSTKIKCKTAGDEAGILLLTGTWHLVFDKRTPELLTAILFSIETAVLTCGVLTLELKGTVLCLELEVTSSKVTHLFHCIQEKGVTKVPVYFNDQEKEVKAELLCSFGGAFKECSLLALAGYTYKEAIFADI